MKRIFIKKFKSIYNEIEIDLLNNGTSVFIGKNGIGKTNCLSAIEWFFNNHSDNQNIKTSLLRGSESETASVTLIEELDDAQIKKIHKVFSENRNGWNLKFDNSIFKDHYNIIQKNGDLIERKYNEDFVSEEEKEYKSVYLKLIHSYLSQGKVLMENSGSDFFDTKIPFFIKNERGEIIGLNNLTIHKYLDAVDEIELPVRPPFKKSNFEMLLKIRDDFNEIKSILEVENRYKVCFIRNADLENKTKQIYSLSQILKPEETSDVKDLVNFLNGHFDFESQIKKISEYQQDKNNNDTSVAIADLVTNLNDKSRDSIKQLFSAFDIYAIPSFNFANNDLVINVTDKNDLDVLERKTEFNSSGYRAFFQFILRLSSIQFECKRNRGLNYIVLADEPEKNLHIVLQKQLFDFLNNITENCDNIQTMYTTHSPYLINAEKSNIFIVDKHLKTDEEKHIKSGSTFIKKFPKKLSDLKGIQSLSLFPIFESLNIFRKSYDDSISGFYKNIFEKNKIIYLCGSIDLSNWGVENFIETAKASGFEIIQNDKNFLNDLEFIDILKLDVEEISKTNFNNFDLILKKSEVKDVKIIYIYKNKSVNK